MLAGRLLRPGTCRCCQDAGAQAWLLLWLLLWSQVRMGKGKGTLDYWAAPIRAGQIIFEFDRCSKATAMQAVAAIRAKMPIKVEFVEWN